MLGVDRRIIGIRSLVDVCENWVFGWLVLHSLLLVRCSGKRCGTAEPILEHSWVYEIRGLVSRSRMSHGSGRYVCCLHRNSYAATTASVVFPEVFASVMELPHVLGLDMFASTVTFVPFPNTTVRFPSPLPEFPSSTTTATI